MLKWYKMSYNSLLGLYKKQQHRTPSEEHRAIWNGRSLILRFTYMIEWASITVDQYSLHTHQMKMCISVVLYSVNDKCVSSKGLSVYRPLPFASSTNLLPSVFLSLRYFLCLFRNLFVVSEVVKYIYVYIYKFAVWRNHVSETTREIARNGTFVIVEVLGGKLTKKSDLGGKRRGVSNLGHEPRHLEGFMETNIFQKQ